MRLAGQRTVGSKEREEQVIKIKRDQKIPTYYAKDLNSRDIKHLKEMTKTGLFKAYNKDQLRRKNVARSVDKVYAEFMKECNHDIDKFAATTPFNRKQLYDLYTKFKALSKFTLQNRDLAREKELDEKMKMGQGGERLSTPKKASHKQTMCRYIDDKIVARRTETRVGVDKPSFMQGIKECRIYNQGILQKIFDSLDEGKKGHLEWPEFLEGMKIVCSKSDKDKVDLFLKMVDSGGDDDGGGGSGGFDFDEIMNICMLTFQDFTSKKQDDPEADAQKANILEETAIFQA